MLDPILSSEDQAALAGRISAGDPAAEEEFARFFRRRILVMATVRTRDREAAADLAQETLMAALTALRTGHLRETGRLAAFVYGTARNVVNNFLRLRCSRPAEEPLAPEHAPFDPQEEVENSERMRLVRDILQRLDATDRKIMLMSLVEGFKPGEIAAQLALSSEAVRARKSRAVKKVIERIQKLSRK